MSNRNRKQQPPKTAPSKKDAPVVPRAHKDIAVEGEPTGLVRQFIADQLNTLPPSQQMVMRATFNTFLNRIVVLAPEPKPEPAATEAAPK